VRGKGQTDGAKKIENCEFLGADDIADVTTFDIGYSRCCTRTSAIQTHIADVTYRRCDHPSFLSLLSYETSVIMA